MKRIVLSLLVLSLSMITVFAVPAKRGLWKTVRLSDGTEVRVELKGDEFCKFWQAEDGRCFFEDYTTGEYGQTDMQRILKRSAANRKALAREESRSGGNDKTKRVAYEGKKKGLIILVNFKDTKFKAENTPELYNRIVNEIGFKDESLGFIGSVKDYFLAQSYGKMEFDFDIVGPVTLQYSYKYYGFNDTYGTDINVREMVTDACMAVDDEVDFSVYDWDGDGNVEQVFFIYAGQCESNNPYDPYLIWPHMSSLSTPLTLDKVRISTYACSGELMNHARIDGIGAICHEFSHCLGLPDFYDIRYGGAYGTGEWDIMCMGCYNGDSFYPAEYTAYERMFVGWLEPTVLETDTDITGMRPLNESKEAYIIYNDNNENEYYMLENRQRTGWDCGLPGSGLIVTHIDYDPRAWSYNVPNSPYGQSQYGISAHERYSLFLADNDSRADSASGDAYPYEGNDSITNLSTPAAMLYNANSDGSYYMNKSIRNITRNDDGTMSFVFVNENKITGDYDLPETYIFYESFDKCNGNGGNDGLFSGSTVGKGSWVGYTDNEGWSSPSGHGASRCAMFGSSLIQGEVTTPLIRIDGECHLLFRAAPYTGDGTELSLSVAEGDAALSETELAMTDNQWTAYDVTVSGSGPVRITLTGTKRFFLDKLCVAHDTTTGIDSLTMPHNAMPSGRIYSLDGRYMGNDLYKLGKGIYLIDGKKIIK